MGVEPRIGKHPKMDGENNGKPYEQMDDLGGKPTIYGNTHMMDLRHNNKERNNGKILQ